ncbi:MAG: hypothetical protein KF708_02940 [Pirellulales bacterium]|nr:hypothetical protein [Pirellulales bacterium]
MQTAPSDRRQEFDWLGVWLLALTIVLVVVVRWRYVDVPLERDEGEYAHIARLLLQGEPLYSTAHTMKYPGTALSYAGAFLLFGESVTTVHLALLPFHLASAALLFALVARSRDLALAALATSLFLLWSMIPATRGLWSHATNFVLPFGLGAWLLLAQAYGDWRGGRAWLLVGVGCLFGISTIMKQQAIFFAIPAVFYCLGRRRAMGATLRDVACLSLGGAISLGVLFAALYQQGVFTEFWFWTVTYARDYAAGNRGWESPFTHAWIAVRNFGRASQLLNGLLLVGLGSLVWDRESRRDMLLWLCLFAGGVLAAIPGLRFTPHYFVLLMPAASYFAAQGIAGLARFVQSKTPLRFSTSLAGSMAVGLLIAGHFEAWFRWDNQQLIWNTYRGHAFMHSRIVAEHLDDLAQEGDTLAVLGSEPQIYFCSDLPSVTSYLYTYPFAEQHRHASRMEAEMQQQIERGEPTYCVVAHSMTSWGVGDVDQFYEPGRILGWWEEYAAEHYEQIGLISVLPDGEAAIAWNYDFERATPVTPVWFELWRRREASPSAR